MTAMDETPARSGMESRAVQFDTGTRLAVDRTRLAYERTLMAWIRTAVSMITFGFTIYKFFQFELRDRPVPSGPVLGPREFALTLIAIGLVSLLLSTVQHRQSMQALRAEYGRSCQGPSLRKWRAFSRFWGSSHWPRCCCNGELDGQRPSGPSLETVQAEADNISWPLQLAAVAIASVTAEFMFRAA